MKSMTFILAVVATLACYWTAVEGKADPAPITPDFLLGGLLVGNVALLTCLASNCNGRGGGGFHGPPHGFHGPPRGFHGPPRGFHGPRQFHGYPRGFSGPSRGHHGPRRGFHGPPKKFH